MSTQTTFRRRDPAEIEPWRETCGQALLGRKSTWLFARTNASNG